MAIIIITLSKQDKSRSIPYLSFRPWEADKMLQLGFEEQLDAVAKVLGCPAWRKPGMMVFPMMTLMTFIRLRIHTSQRQHGFL